MNYSIFAERLSELLFESQLNPPAFAAKIGCGRNTINRYLSGNNMPALNLVIRMADYFTCSVDFLMGAAQENQNASFKDCPNFSEQLKFLCEHFGKTKYQLQKATQITESAIYSWQSGNTTPTIESIEKIADFFDCSMDFILGRET